MKRTMTTCLFLGMISALSLCLAGSAFAAVTWSDGDPGNSLWTDVDNWSGGALPVIADSTFVKTSALVAGGDGPVIQAGDALVARNLAFEAGDGTLTMTMTGGQLDLYNPGSTNCYFRLGAGGGSGAAILNMSDGLLTVHQDVADSDSGLLRIGSGYHGEVNMTGGTIEVEKLSIAPDTNSYLDLSNDAAVIVLGDVSDQIQGYIDAGLGQVTSNGGAVASVLYAYDPTSGMTTITAIPEPATILLLGLGLVGLGLYGRRRLV